MISDTASLTLEFISETARRSSRVSEEEAGAHQAVMMTWLADPVTLSQQLLILPRQSWAMAGL